MHHILQRSILTACLLLSASLSLSAQDIYWVFLTDKNGSTFDPYTYFDAKAIERYRLNGFNLNDSTNYPLSQHHTDIISQHIDSEIGRSRWLNAVAVECSAEQATLIATLPFVKRVVAIEASPTLLTVHSDATPDSTHIDQLLEQPLSDQLLRMGADHFRKAGIDGKGVRIAVFDGGFPRVDTHRAFAHLRDNNRIVKTWNFPNNKANVYGWNSHGTMTLSCIAGIAYGKEEDGTHHHGTLMGMATGAEFMLARTEVALEPRKEEVWWLQAMEWADAGGADIISSSLGYGKENHYTTDMDGTSLVARAATMAARRGILVCNSAGNEGDDRQWRTIITPSDADSVMCVAGIEASLLHYRKIDFSSIGPSADGRRKPNVAAFGYALTANVHHDSSLHHVYGTSFSCPLVAGFAACAWQTDRSLTAMQLFSAIEHSADLYPYYDYALGYGVPQASHFVDTPPSAIEPTFRFEVIGDYLRLTPTVEGTHATIFTKIQLPDGRIKSSDSYEFGPWTTDNTLFITNASLSEGQQWIVWANGYCDSLQQMSTTAKGTAYICALPTDEQLKPTHTYSIYHTHTSLWGDNSRYSYDIFYASGTAINSRSEEITLKGYSTTHHIGLRLLRACSKSYRLGVALEWSQSNYHLIAANANAIDNALNLTINDIRKKTLRQTDLSIELFQRIRMVAGGLISGRGLYLDMGIYGSHSLYNYHTTLRHTGIVDEQQSTYPHLSFADAYRWNYGITLRAGIDAIALYARYRLTAIGHRGNATPPDFYIHPPRLEVGLQIAL